MDKKMYQSNFDNMQDNNNSIDLVINSNLDFNNLIKLFNDYNLNTSSILKACRLKRSKKLILKKVIYDIYNIELNNINIAVKKLYKIVINYIKILPFLVKTKKRGIKKDQLLMFKGYS